ncbi:hypothetical protein DOTSEDRAFT_70859 [Dothistroma septosporum NZE10]|uniref:DUF221-domain-containing protein n=1 Tax=Dothistroma septosporum (strain NZE10 / CBS 128990) TaxID=675120 RepID=N1PRA0_DOTSN|nr:hypothetical protein DOTSEDRAFT_70859 [Dothistroma septosporum NZE10]
MDTIGRMEKHVFARQQGSNQNSQGSSLSALLSTLIPVLLSSSVVFLAFLIFRKKYTRVYQPRSDVGPLRNWQRSPKQTTGLLGWKKEYNELKDEFVLGHASIDNYLWLRFFKMLSVMCLVGCFITWPILFPVNATGKGAATGLDILSFSHIEPGPRYYAQTFVSWLFLAWVMFMITRESKFFVRLSQRYYLSPYQRSRISTRTILFTNVPEAARNEEHLRNEYAGVRAVWLVNVPLDLAEKADNRDKAATKLENGEIKMLKNHYKRQLKLEKKGQASDRVNPESGVKVEVNKKDIPTHRLPKLKFLPIGKKVETIDWARGELRRLVPEVSTEQRGLLNDTSNAQAACFIEFDTVQSAYAAWLQAGTKGTKEKTKSKAKMTPKELGVEPKDVIWKNTIKPLWKTKLFSTLGTTFIWWLCIFWTIPVAVIGAISNINYLTNKVPFLGFIDDIPKVILGLVTGLLPVILLAVLMALVPIICSIIAKLFEPTQASVQMKVQGWYFPFQVIQVFLITTFASGASSVVTQIIQQPSSAATLLAQNLPKASNFYISYFILFGLQTAAMQFLNVVPLLFFLILGKILDTTPRKMYNRYVNLAGLGWGSLYPKFTNLGVIALSYSCISPLILGFATIGFFLLYLAYRYSTLFILGTNVSTRGQSYARAMKQLTVGIYISEICLIGLFAIGIASNRQAIGPLVLMIIFLVATIAWQVWLGRSLRKLEADLAEDIIAPSAITNEIRDSSDVEKAPVSVHDGRPTGYSDNADHLAKDGYAEQDNAPHQQMHQNSAGKVGLMARIKGYFNPDAAASNAIQFVSPNLSIPIRAYTQREHDEAYTHPAIISECPIIWVARDKYGISRQEIAASKDDGYIMTDEAAEFNEKGKIEWSANDYKSAPIWRDEPTY